MNSVAHDVATLLQQKSFGKVGTDIFIDEFSESVDAQILISNTGGFESESKNAYEKPTFQILARGERNASSMFTYDIINRVYSTLLNFDDNVMINETEYLGFECNGNILTLGRDDNQCMMYSANFYTFRNVR